ncbi:MAG: ThuA domain-containing protein [Planctomycetia bacterium]|nr:ThuA domain-containing protein [Planctomycetia bacterium]
MTKLISLAALLLLATASYAQNLKLLYLGDNGHHQPRVRFHQLAPVMKARGIELVYTDQMKDLNPATLKEYAGLVVYANIDAISKEQAEALLSYVAEGKGFIPLHCASYCFRNNDEIVKLIGAQFKSHGTGTFRTVQAKVDHPILQGFTSFESWDETYVHSKHNEANRTVLEYRPLTPNPSPRGGEGNQMEPWTWVRTHGKGRVFYTAWGHDERTWGHPGFHNLVERGIRWACGSNDLSNVISYADAPKMTAKRTDVAPFEYVPAKVPFYPPSKTWGVTTEPLPKMQKPLSPEESLKHYVHPVGFEMKLFASEPLIQGKPICMNWDEQGRLWLAETIDYPNEKKPEGQGRDRLVIFEDTDGDGVADKRTVFVEGLSIPTSIAFAHGGVIVHQAPHTLFFKNNNDKAGPKQILFTGWGVQDTHAGPSNLQYGLDGWFYGSVGYSGFRGEVNGEQLRFGQGYYRFKLDPVPLSGGTGARGDGEAMVKCTKLEFLASTNNNTWGLGFSEEGILFGSTANGNPSVCMPIPNRYYEKVKGWSASVLPSISGDAAMHPITDQVRQVDYHGRFTAAAGHALYTARFYPKEYWNRTAFVCEPTGHLVACFELTPDGASFRSRNAWNLVASDDEWASPIMAEVGPDSCVWILDWYNYIVQHNPTPAGFKTGKGAAYETELRDKKHGRVYRLVPKDKPLPAKVNLKGAKPEMLVETLKNENFFWRRQAQRLLVENDTLQNREAVLKLSHQKDLDSIAARHVFAVMGILIKGPAEHPSIKGNDAMNAVANILGFIDKCERPDFFKGIAGLQAIQYMQRFELIQQPVVRDAITILAAQESNSFLSLLCVDSDQPSPASSKIISIVATHYARSSEFSKLKDIIKFLHSADRSVSIPIIQAWAANWPNKPLQLDEEGKQYLTTLITKAPNEVRSQVIKLGMIWDAEVTEKYAQQMKGELFEQLADAKVTDENRLTIARDLIALMPSDDSVVEKIVASITPRMSSQTAVTMIKSLENSLSAKLSTILLGRMKEFTPTTRTEAIRLLLGRAAFTKALLAAIEKNDIPLTELSLDQRQSLLLHPDEAIASQAKALLARGGGLPSADRQKVIDSWLPLTKKIGDAPKGKLIFTQHCAKCHQYAGEGKHIGPDLTGMAVHPKEELVIHILDPHRSVEGNYRSYTVVLNDGKVLNGMMAAESKTSVEIIDTEGKTTAIQRDDIDQLVVTNKSLMPEGFEKQMNEAEFTNLMEFLTQKGKYVPLPLDKVATITTAKGMFFGDEGTFERLIFPDWKPKTFNSVPFLLIDPQEGKINNAVLLYGPQGQKAPKMPRTVSIPCAAPVKTLHFLSGISGWGYPATNRQSTSMIVRLKYADGQTEDHPLRNGVHFADYAGKTDVPESKFAFDLQGRQLRYLSVSPKRSEPLASVELVKGNDPTAPVVMAITAELR